MNRQVISRVHLQITLAGGCLHAAGKTDQLLLCSGKERYTQLLTSSHQFAGEELCARGGQHHRLGLVHRQVGAHRQQVGDRRGRAHQGAPKQLLIARGCCHSLRAVCQAGSSACASSGCARKQLVRSHDGEQYVSLTAVSDMLGAVREAGRLHHGMA